MFSEVTFNTVNRAINTKLLKNVTPQTDERVTFGRCKGVISALNICYFPPLKINTPVWRWGFSLKGCHTLVLTLAEIVPLKYIKRI